ncbi:hypothetical protein GUJ93_ZPchr0001g33136 [Zizania palustris]|uniref:Uncharacterized protein n=1 Tax=Zizania palustris TaxID=103762 RepID=A0A8J5RX92_ZIZPA|nr:hypothetical protein GUJ93_ZPchr0001g33136 [Zizania palustris]
MHYRAFACWGLLGQYGDAVDHLGASQWPGGGERNRHTGVSLPQPELLSLGWDKSTNRTSPGGDQEYVVWYVQPKTQILRAIIRAVEDYSTGSGGKVFRTSNNGYGDDNNSCYNIKLVIASIGGCRAISSSILFATQVSHRLQVKWAW